MVIPLATVFQASGAQILHPYILVALQREEDVILISIEIMLCQFVHVIAMGQSQAMDGKLLVQDLLGCEGVLQRTHILELLITETVSHVTAGKPVLAQVDISHAT